MFMSKVTAYIIHETRIQYLQHGLVHTVFYQAKSLYCKMNTESS